MPGLTKAQTDSLKNDFRIGLNFLAHGEICGVGLPRDINSTENHSAFILGRTRLALDYQRDNWFQVHLMLQNNAVWGMQGNQTLGLYEGWVKATAPSGLFAQIGRIALSYDDERIIGPNGFAAAARSHDVLRVGYEGHEDDGDTQKGGWQQTRSLGMVLPGDQPYPFFKEVVSGSIFPYVSIRHTHSTGP